MNQPRRALDLLSGDAETFLAKVWATRVHVHQVEPALVAPLLSLDDVDRLLTASAIRTPAVRLARDGAVLPESSYTRGGSLAGRPLTGLVDPVKALAELERGATVVLQGLHRYWEPLTELVADLEVELGHPCQVNAYLTPPGAQGFAVHEDSHDVFVVQTAGRKQWEVHTPDGVEVLALEPGTCLYLPTGTPHAARTQDTLSLHVTIGINQLTWRGLVERATARALAGVDDGRVPAGYLEDPEELAAGLARRLTDLAEEVLRVDPRAAADDHVDWFLTSRNSRLRHGLCDVLSVRDLTDATRLRRRPGTPVVLRHREEGRLRVLLGDRSLEMPAWLEPAMGAVRDTSRLRPADLAAYGLDPESRLVLCRRLVREGLLEVDG